MPNDRIDRSTQQKTHGAQRRQALYNIAGQASHAINDIFNEQLRRLYGAQWEEEAYTRSRVVVNSTSWPPPCSPPERCTPSVRRTGIYRNGC